MTNNTDVLIEQENRTNFSVHTGLEPQTAGFILGIPARG